MIYIILFFLFLFGLTIGSFLNAVNYRLVHDMSLKGRSECTACHHQLNAADLIPLLSFLFLKGKCRYCKKLISPRYPLTEATTGLGFLFVGFWLFVPGNGSLVSGDWFLNSVTLFYYLFIVAALVGIASADFSWGIIPDRLVFPAIAVSFLFQLGDIAYRDIHVYFQLKNDVGLGPYLLPPHSDYFTNIVRADIFSFLWALGVGAAIAVFFLALIYFTSGRAMGLGDVKLGFLIGLLVGWPAALSSLFLAFLTGALASVILILVGKKRFGGTISFGPFLSLGALLGLFWGQVLVDTYLKIFR